MEVVYQPIAVEKKETAIPQKIEPKVGPPESVSRHQVDAGVAGVRDESLAGESTKRVPSIAIRTAASGSTALAFKERFKSSVGSFMNI